MTKDQTKRIVVGIDGSEDARRALAWALEEARLRGCAVEAIIAYEVPISSSIPLLTPMIPPELFREYAEGAVEKAVRSMVGSDTEAVPVAKFAVAGHPGHVLIDAAAGAELLVVGARGNGGFLGLRLGSVSNYCVHHAPCPVAIIPAASPS